MSAGKLPEYEVSRWKARTEELLTALKRRTRTLPPGVSVEDFILCDGSVPTDVSVLERKETTFGELRDAYAKAFANGAIEANTLYTAKLHLKRLEETLGRKFLLNGLTPVSLQAHIDRRTANVESTTVKKEIDTFRVVFNWGKTASLTTGDCLALHAFDSDLADAVTECLRKQPPLIDYARPLETMADCISGVLRVATNQFRRLTKMVSGRRYRRPFVGCQCQRHP